MKTMKSLNDFDLMNHCGYGAYFFEKENVRVSVFRDCIKIIDLTNAQKVGKTCQEITLVSRHYSWEESIKINILNAIGEMSFHDFILATLENPEYIKTFNEEIIVETDEEKGVYVFSPFYKNKKIKSPKKWTIRTVIKAIYSGQLIEGKKTMRLTDDYAYDAAANFGKGTLDQLSFVKDLIESPSGWRVRQDEIDKTVIYVNCHHFDYNQFVFVEGGSK